MKNLGFFLLMAFAAFSLIEWSYNQTYRHEAYTERYGRDFVFIHEDVYLHDTNDSVRIYDNEWILWPLDEMYFVPCKAVDYHHEVQILTADLCQVTFCYDFFYQIDWEMFINNYDTKLISQYSTDNMAYSRIYETLRRNTANKQYDELVGDIEGFEKKVKTDVFDNVRNVRGIKPLGFLLYLKENDINNKN